MPKKPQERTVFITGGAGYVGSLLVPILLEKGYKVKVLDLYMYGDVLEKHANLEEIKGDLRDQALLKKHLKGCTDVIHLACISNDPSFELDSTLGKSINFDAFMPLVDISKESGVTRFIYASSSSVYGIKEDDNVTEDLPLEPLTDYSKFKAMCEDELFKRRDKNFKALVIRPSTVCGYAPRLRLDLTVNILTNHAINNGKITVFGGGQKRPNIHIKDMCEVYVQALSLPDEKIDGKIYNAGYENFTVMDIAKMVKKALAKDVEIAATPTNDNRSYHVSSEKIKKDWGFVAKHTIEDAVKDLKAAFEAGKIKDPMTNTMYYNIKRMQELKLK